MTDQFSRTDLSNLAIKGYSANPSNAREFQRHSLLEDGVGTKLVLAQRGKPWSGVLGHERTRDLCSRGPDPIQEADSGIAQAFGLNQTRRVGFGKHQGQTFGQVWSNYPAYCEWVVESAAKGGAGRSLVEFALWLQQRSVGDYQRAAVQGTLRDTVPSGTWESRREWHDKIRGSTLSAQHDKEERAVKPVSLQDIPKHLGGGGREATFPWLSKRGASARDEAERAEQELREREGCVPEASRLAQLGGELAKQGKWPQACDTFRAAEAAARFNDVNIKRSYGMALCQTGQFGEAETVLRVAREMQPDDARVVLMLGSALVELGQPANAVSELRLAVALDGKKAAGHRLLGMALHQLGDDTQAVDALNQAIRLDPFDSVAFYWLGLSHGSQSQHSQAEAALREAIRLDSRNHEYHSILATVLQLQGKPELAKPLYERACKLAPHNAAARYGLALSLRDMGDLAGHARELHHALELNPALHAQAHAELAAVWRPSELASDELLPEDWTNSTGSEVGLEQLNSSKLSKWDTLSRLTSDQLHEDMLSEGGAKSVDDWMNTKQHELSQAQQALEQLTNQAASDLHRVAPVDYAGPPRSLVAVQIQPDKEKALRSSLRMDPTNPVGWNNLGNLLRRENRVLEAQDAFRQAIELDPTHPAAAYNLETLLRELDLDADANQVKDSTADQMARVPGVVGDRWRSYHQLTRFFDQNLGNPGCSL